MGELGDLQPSHLLLDPRHRLSARPESVVQRLVLVPARQCGRRRIWALDWDGHQFAGSEQRLDGWLVRRMHPGPVDRASALPRPATCRRLSQWGPPATLATAVHLGISRQRGRYGRDDGGAWSADVRGHVSCLGLLGHRLGAGAVDRRGGYSLPSNASGLLGAERDLFTDRPIAPGECPAAAGAPGAVTRFG